MAENLSKHKKANIQKYHVHSNDVEITVKSDVNIMLIEHRKKKVEPTTPMVAVQFVVMTNHYATSDEIALKSTPPASNEKRERVL